MLSILACWGLEVDALLLLRACFGGTGGGGTGGAWGWKKGCTACRLESRSGGSAGACMVAFARLRLMSASFRMVSRGVCRPWQCRWAVIKGVVEVVLPRVFCLQDKGLCVFRSVWTVGGSLNPVECRVERFPRGAFLACDSGGLKESLPASWGGLGVYLLGVGLGRHEDPVCPVEDPP